MVPEGEILSAAHRYMPWVAVSPLIVVIGFQLDGIFIGATHVRAMRDSMIITGAILLPSSIIFAQHYGNHGLWAAFSLYFVLRAVTLGVFYPRLARVFDTPPPKNTQN